MRRPLSELSEQEPWPTNPKAYTGRMMAGRSTRTSRGRIGSVRYEVAPNCGATSHIKTDVCTEVCCSCWRKPEPSGSITSIPFVRMQRSKWDAGSLINSDNETGSYRPCSPVQFQSMISKLADSEHP